MAGGHHQRVYARGGHDACVRRGECSMKINKVSTRIVKTPGDSPLVFDQPPATATFDFVTLELGTDQGLTGAGVTFFGEALLGALKVAVQDLATLLIGDDPTQTEKI